MTETERAKQIRALLDRKNPEIVRFIETLLKCVDEWKATKGRADYYYFKEIDIPTRIWLGNPANDEATVTFDVNSVYAQMFKGADLSRLKRCEVCEKVFWAFPSHKAGCNPRHSNTIAKRNQRKQPIRNKEGRHG